MKKNYHAQSGFSLLELSFYSIFSSILLVMMISHYFDVVKSLLDNQSAISAEYNLRRLENQLRADFKEAENQGDEPQFLDEKTLKLGMTSWWCMENHGQKVVMRRHFEGQNNEMVTGVLYWRWQRVFMPNHQSIFILEVRLQKSLKRRMVFG